MFINRLDQLDTTTFYPVLLEVFKRYRNPEYRQDFDQILADLEVLSCSPGRLRTHEQELQRPRCAPD